MEAAQIGAATFAISHGLSVSSDVRGDIPGPDVPDCRARAGLDRPELDLPQLELRASLPCGLQLPCP
jgi:hypothetical protein